MIDSLAEHVVAPVSTNDARQVQRRQRLPAVLDCASEERHRRQRLPVTGSIDGCLSLNCSRSNVLPGGARRPAIMYATSLAMPR